MGGRRAAAQCTENLLPKSSHPLYPERLWLKPPLTQEQPPTVQNLRPPRLEGKAAAMGSFEESFDTRGFSARRGTRAKLLRRRGPKAGGPQVNPTPTPTISKGGGGRGREGG